MDKPVKDKKNEIRHWIPNTSAFGLIIGFQCSDCKGFSNEQLDYCPHCNNPIKKVVVLD